jgi:hypothetical protein
VSRADITDAMSKLQLSEKALAQVATEISHELVTLRSKNQPTPLPTASYAPTSNHNAPMN